MEKIGVDFSNNDIIFETKNPLSNLLVKNLSIIILPARTFLFGFIQILFVYLLGFSWKESIAWWPFYAIITNIIMFYVLYFLTKREGKSYLDIINFDKKHINLDFKRILWVLPIGAGLGLAGMSFVSFIMYGSPALPDNMILPLPFWAGIIAFIFFPITNTLVEVPTYMGYCFPRIEKMLKSKVFALVLSAFFLAFQHFTLPIFINDLKYMSWHFLCFIPLSLIVGLIYIKIRNLVSIMIVHWLLDVLVVLGVFILSIS
ncbi:type II CAAX prenyl endopeptidase Rce1 family protein [Fredinandcohnia humi]